MCLANAVELNIYFLMSIMTAAKGPSRIEDASSLITLGQGHGGAGGDDQCGNHSACLTGLCYSVTLNVFYFPFKNCFSSNFVIY